MYRVIKAKTDEEMTAELNQHFSELNKKIAEFNRPGRTKRWTSIEIAGIPIERHSVQDLYNNYIKYFNRNVDDYGDGFAADWDPDDVMIILYKNGKARRINPADDDGKKKISIDNIDSIIIDGSWGSAFAGPHVEIYNYREVVDYGKWGYKDLEQRYNDEDSIRLDFSVPYKLIN